MAITWPGTGSGAGTGQPGGSVTPLPALPASPPEPEALASSYPASDGAPPPVPPAPARPAAPAAPPEPALVPPLEPVPGLDTSPHAIAATKTGSPPRTRTRRVRMTRRYRHLCQAPDFPHRTGGLFRDVRGPGAARGARASEHRLPRAGGCARGSNVKAMPIHWQT